jgi:hypothetical protein
MLSMIVVLVLAIRIYLKRNALKNAELTDAARREAEEKLRVYQDAWAAARAADNIDVLLKCGEYLVKATLRWQPHLMAPVAWDVYTELLRRLKTKPELKPAALEMGRTAYAARRPGGALTVYDEQAIQNDILAHIE